MKEGKGGEGEKRLREKGGRGEGWRKGEKKKNKSTKHACTN